MDIVRHIRTIRSVFIRYAVLLITVKQYDYLHALDIPLSVHHIELIVDG